MCPARGIRPRRTPCSRCARHRALRRAGSASTCRRIPRIRPRCGTQRSTVSHRQCSSNSSGSGASHRRQRWKPSATHSAQRIEVRAGHAGTIRNRVVPAAVGRMVDQRLGRGLERLRRRDRHRFGRGRRFGGGRRRRLGGGFSRRLRNALLRHVDVRLAGFTRLAALGERVLERHQRPLSPSKPAHSSVRWNRLASSTQTTFSSSRIEASGVQAVAAAAQGLFDRVGQRSRRSRAHAYAGRAHVVVDAAFIVVDHGFTARLGSEHFARSGRCSRLDGRAGLDRGLGLERAVRRVGGIRVRAWCRPRRWIRVRADCRPRRWIRVRGVVSAPFVDSGSGVASASPAGSALGEGDTSVKLRSRDRMPFPMAIALSGSGVAPGTDSGSSSAAVPSLGAGRTGGPGDRRGRGLLAGRGSRGGRGCVAGCGSCGRCGRIAGCGSCGRCGRIAGCGSCGRCGRIAGARGSRRRWAHRWLRQSQRTRAHRWARGSRRRRVPRWDRARTSRRRNCAHSPPARFPDRCRRPGSPSRRGRARRPDRPALS